MSDLRGYVLQRHYEPSESSLESDFSRGQPLWLSTWPMMAARMNGSPCDDS